MQHRRWHRFQCYGVAAVCLLLFLAWGYSYSDSGDGDGWRVTESRTTLGLPFSPWFEYVDRTERRDQPNNSVRSQTVRGRVLWASWSWLALIGFVVFWKVARRLRPIEPEAKADERRDQAGAPQADLRDPG